MPFVEWGYNLDLIIFASILDYKLTYYSEEIKRRREIADIYEGIREPDSLLLPPQQHQKIILMFIKIMKFKLRIEIN